MENRNGFTLIETLIALGIFAIVATALYFAYANVLDIFSASYLNLTALGAMDNELEIIRNMAYKDVGIQGGTPAGKLLAEKNITFSNIRFTVKMVVRNVDDPFDGTQGGTPNDTAPADYKLIEIEISCSDCPRFIPARTTTTVAPPGLETVTNKGTLIVKALNASGQPISGANVSVINNSVTPPININDVTDTSGILKLVDTATSSAGYAITVTKSGYSTDQTYLPGALPNPNPLKPYASVFQQQITQVSFIIDRVSTLNIKTQDKFCAAVGSIDLLQTGQKIIGTNPNVLKYSVVHVTNASGLKTISNLEFDAYDFKNQDGTYEVAGFTPLTPIAVDPNGTYGLTWLMEAKSPSALAVSVKNQSGQLVNDAKVTLTKLGFSEIKYSGRRFFTHTNWSNNQHDSKSVNMEADSPAGELHIVQIGGKYASLSDEWLVSQTVDLGTSSTSFYNLLWNPIDQPLQTGANSLKVQIATNNDNIAWNFIGPNGTDLTYYTASDTQIHSSHNGKRYLRYKVILRTEDELVTPKLEDMILYFRSSCITNGQNYFSGLTQATYTITVEKSGYQTFTDTAVVVDENWEDYRATLIP
ncbi:MAG: prepilin-type N-terminal cleavage/methylation domain-containing protein [Candidatus Taylorbacteria bacterium]|nr:prepilin-type N-terminal cleavage/methylation domain-containing protein [Candidatus Taylorbacteria bacterium]